MKASALLPGARGDPRTKHIMPVTDYSKWANMEFKDEDDEDGRPRKPRVTRLEGPSRITLGAPEPTAAATAITKQPAAATASSSSAGAGTRSGQAAAAKPKSRSGLDYAKWDAFEDSDDAISDEDEFADEPQPIPGNEDDEEDELDERELQQLKTRLGPSMLPPPPAATAVPPPAPPVADDPEARLALRQKALTRNGAARDTHLWRQTDREVELSVLLPPGTRARELRPELREADLIVGTRQRLILHRVGAGSGGTGVVSGALGDFELAYSVVQPESAEELRWEVTDYEPAGGRRLLHVTLQKEMPHGVTIWWERAVVGDAAVDTTTLPDRRWADRLPGQQSGWQEAQRLFREKVAARERTPIWVDSGEVGDGMVDDMVDGADAEDPEAARASGEAAPAAPL